MFFSQNRAWAFIVFVLFFILAIFFTRIPFGNIGSVLPTDGDPMLVSYIWSWEMEMLPNDPLNLFHANIFYPFKYTLLFTEHMLGSLVLAWPLFLIFNNIMMSFNLVSLLSFAIGGLGMYLLLEYLTKNKYVAVIGAFIYAFAPFKIHHLEHINLGGMWLPYVFLWLRKFLNENTWRNILLLTFFVALSFLNGLQYFIFLCVCIFLIFFSDYLLNKFKLSRNNLLKMGLCFLIFLFLVAPIAWSYISMGQEFDFNRAIGSIEGLSPDLVDYFISPFVYKYFYPVFFPEWAIGPGWFVLILFFFSSWFIFKKRQELVFRTIIYYIIGILAVLFSFGYYIQLTRADTFGLMGPWAFFYHFVPGADGIRVLGRFSIFFLIASCIIISYGLSEFFDSIVKKHWKKLLITLFIISLLAFEFSFAHPRHYASIGQPCSAIYEWVNDQNDDNVYLEMPMGIDHLRRNYNALHEYCSIGVFHKTVNGYSGYAPDDYTELNKELFKFNSEDVDFVLNYGVTHIIFHFDCYAESYKEYLINEIEKNEYVELVKIEDNDYVYKIN